MGIQYILLGLTHFDAKTPEKGNQLNIVFFNSPLMPTTTVYFEIQQKKSITAQIGHKAATATS